MPCARRRAPPRNSSANIETSTRFPRTGVSYCWISPKKWRLGLPRANGARLREFVAAWCGGGCSGSRNEPSWETRERRRFTSPLLGSRRTEEEEEGERERERQRERERESGRAGARATRPVYRSSRSTASLAAMHLRPGHRLPAPSPSPLSLSSLSFAGRCPIRNGAGMNKRENSSDRCPLLLRYGK